jgi:hypothetical protein
MENITYWNEVREFRKQLKKVIIPIEKFFREKYIKNTPIVEDSSKIEV